MTRSLGESVTSSDADSLEGDAMKLGEIIQTFRELIEGEKHLRVRRDDNFLLRYLRCSNYNPEMGLRKMQIYYKHKYLNPDWYVTDETIHAFKNELSNKFHYVLEDTDRFGKRIYINRLGMLDPSKTAMARQSQLQDFFLECLLDDETTQKNGVSVLVDLKNFSWNLLKWLTPANVCVAVKKVESLPFKKIEFHVVNTSAVINAAIKLIWPFLSYKTKENIHFHHEDWSSLHKTIPAKHLPSQYGGTKTNLDIDKLLEIIPGGNEKLKENLLLGYTQI